LICGIPVRREQDTAAGDDRRSALVLHMNALGEALFALPLLHALKHASPPWRTVSVIRKGVADLIRASGLADEVLLRPESAGIGDAWRLIRAARATHPSICFALSTSRSNSLLAWLSGAPRRIGYRHADLSVLLETVPSESGGVENYLSLLPVAGIGRTVDSYCGLLPVPADARGNAADLLREGGIEARARFVAVAPASTGKLGHKAYPVEQWAAACRLMGERGWPLVLVGSAADAGLHQRLLSGAKGRAVSLAGKTSPLALAGVLGRAACVVGIDTGPIHLAAAVGTRCVALFGSSDPMRTAPCGDGHVILYQGLDCQPCLDRRCGNEGACLRLIAPQEIVDAVAGVVSDGHES